MKERRVSQRFSIELPMRYRSVSNPSEEQTASIVNISAEGLCLLCPVEFEKGSKLVITIELEQNDFVTLIVEVMWTSKVGFRENFGIGVKIVEASVHDEAKFVRFCSYKIASLTEKYKKILVVEDERDLAMLLQKILEEANYEVMCAYDGIEGYEKYLKEHPDLVILDVGLPRLNGNEVCKRIRRESQDVATPVIMLTGHMSDADRIIGRVVGAEVYMTKPFDSAELVSIIKELIARVKH